MIYLFLAPGFEETEAMAPADILRRAGHDLRLVGVGGKAIRGSHGITVACDLEESELGLDGLEMVVLPGGMPGTLNLEHSAVVRSMAAYAAHNGLWLGAICAAPSILGHMGLLDGKKVTCFPGFEDQLGSAAFTGAPVERDGNVITGRGAGCAVEFGLALLEALDGAPRAEAMRKGLQCP